MQKEKKDLKLKKEEILARSREENKYGDEREKNHYELGIKVGFCVAMIMLIIIAIVNLIQGRYPCEIFAVIFSMFAVNNISIGIVLKRYRKWKIFYLCVGIIIGIVAVYMLVWWGLQLGGVL